ncbi:MAG: BREX protein BrxB domain-containing protein [Deltaproteobacteria bacterium]|nr:BREX protein BrxB domain-containing protein [Deltaproteobacteria bacterium]
MSTFHHPTRLATAVEALRKDLLLEGGPRIATLRNYNFAILPYDPAAEFEVRERIHRLCQDLRESGWNTFTIALNRLLLRRLRSLGNEYLEKTINREKRLFEKGLERSLEHLKSQVVDELEGPNGLAADVVKEIERFMSQPAQDGTTSLSPERTVIFIGRAGSLFPFFRTSSLLKHMADHTHNLPVVLLYPGKSVGDTGLSFMGVLPADRDYRPRIYR